MTFQSISQSTTRPPCTHYCFYVHTDKFKWHQQDFPVPEPLEITFPRALIPSHVLELSLLSKAESGGGLSWQFTFWRALSKWQLVYSGSPVQLRPVSHINEFQNGYCQDLALVPNVVRDSNRWTSHSYQISDVCRLKGETIYPQWQQWQGLLWHFRIRVGSLPVLISHYGTCTLCGRVGNAVLHCFPCFQLSDFVNPRLPIKKVN